MLKKYKGMFWEIKKVNVSYNAKLWIIPNMRRVILQYWLSFITSENWSENLSNENKQWYFCCLHDKKWIKMPKWCENTECLFSLLRLSHQFSDVIIEVDIWRCRKTQLRAITNLLLKMMCPSSIPFFSISFMLNWVQSEDEITLTFIICFISSGLKWNKEKNKSHSHILTQLHL